jgi:hypothetical protein
MLIACSPPQSPPQGQPQSQDASATQVPFDATALRLDTDIARGSTAMRAAPPLKLNVLDVINDDFAAPGFLSPALQDAPQPFAIIREEARLRVRGNVLHDPNMDTNSLDDYLQSINGGEVNLEIKFK